MMEVCETLDVMLVDPTESQAVGAAAFYFEALTDMVIVGLSVAPGADSSSATFDINDDGSGVITGVDASDADAPGTWKARGFGGTNDPVVIAKGSKVSFDINSGTAAIAYFVHLRYLAGLS